MMYNIIHERRFRCVVCVSCVTIIIILRVYKIMTRTVAHINDNVSKVGRRTHHPVYTIIIIIIIRLVGSTRNVNTDCGTTVARIGRHLAFFNTSTPFYCHRFFKLSTLNSRRHDAAHNNNYVTPCVCLYNSCHTPE